MPDDNKQQNESTGVGLYQNYLRTLGNQSGGTATTGNTSAYTGGGSVWDSLFGNLGGILIGAGGLVTAFKSDPNKIAEYQSQTPIYIPGIGNTNVNNSTIWIILGLLLVVAVVVFLVIKSKK